MPLALAALTIYFTTEQGAREAGRQSAQAAHDRKTARRQHRDHVVEAYLDRMATLILRDHLLISRRGSGVRRVATAMTATALRELDGSRRTIIVRFLLDAKLIGQRGSADVDLRFTTLRSIDLRSMSLTNLDVDGADLTNARFDGSTVSDSTFDGARLRNASFRGAEFDVADLEDADLSGASFEGMTILPRLKGDFTFGRGVVLLQNSCINRTNFGGADLRGATLDGVRGRGVNLERARLRGTSLSSAYLPNADFSSARVEGRLPKTLRHRPRSPLYVGGVDGPRYECRA